MVGVVSFPEVPLPVAWADRSFDEIGNRVGHAGYGELSVAHGKSALAKLRSGARKMALHELRGFVDGIHWVVTEHGGSTRSEQCARCLGLDDEVKIRVLKRIAATGPPMPQIDTYTGTLRCRVVECCNGEQNYDFGVAGVT